MQSKFSRGLLVRMLITVIFTVIAVLFKGNKLSTTTLIAQVADMLAFVMTDRTLNR